METKDFAHLSKKETREYITPYALNISDEIIGLPLASPSSRFAALLVDGIIVAILSALNGNLLAICYALVMLRLSFKEKTEASLSSSSQGISIKGFYRKALRFFGVVILLFAGIAFAVDTFTKADTTESASENSAVVATDTKAAIAAYFSFPDYSIVKWVKGIFNDLGVGFGWASIYFTVFISWWNGQTPGKKLLGIRVIQIDNSPISLWDSFGRYGGYGAGLVTGLLGFLQIFWDPNRQAIQDKISSTLVIDLGKKKIEFV